MAHSSVHPRAFEVALRRGGHILDARIECARLDDRAEENDIYAAHTGVNASRS